MTTASAAAWPALSPAAWAATARTMRAYVRVVGQARLALGADGCDPGDAPLHVTVRGLTTALVPTAGPAVELSFDLVEEALVIATDRGAVRKVPLGLPVADFHRQVGSALRAVGAGVEMPPGPFECDFRQATFDADQARLAHQALLRADAAFRRLRAAWGGGTGPARFGWDAFELTITRWADRPDDGAARFRLAFRPADAAFVATMAPAPPGWTDADPGAPAARWEPAVGGFVLPYEAVSGAADADATLLAFARAAADVGARLGGWARPGAVTIARLSGSPPGSP